MSDPDTFPLYVVATRFSERSWTTRERGLKRMPGLRVEKRDAGEVSFDNLALEDGLCARARTVARSPLVSRLVQHHPSTRAKSEHPG